MHILCSFLHHAGAQPNSRTNWFFDGDDTTELSRGGDVFDIVKWDVVKVRRGILEGVHAKLRCCREGTRLEDNRVHHVAKKSILSCLLIEDARRHGVV